MQKHVNLVDLVKSFPTNIYLQNLASIQKRMSPVKFAHLAEKSDKGSISNLSTKVQRAVSDARFDQAMGVVIIVNSISLGFEITASLEGRDTILLEALEKVFICIHLRLV